MSAAGKRMMLVAASAVLVCVLIGLYIGLYLTTSPGSASASATRTAGGAQLYLATVAASETSDPHPSWVSYYQVDAHDQNWHHATTYVLPRDSLVHVTVFQFDGQSGLRNPFIAQAQGIVGGSFTVNGKPMVTLDPDAASHVFAIPQLGVSVPLLGVADDAKNQCGNAPCPLSTAHYTVSFTFRTAGPGLYRWQCFVPCAAGFINGFGGAMQTVGYMDGYIKVV